MLRALLVWEGQMTGSQGLDMDVAAREAKQLIVGKMPFTKQPSSRQQPSSAGSVWCVPVYPLQVKMLGLRANAVLHETS